MVPGHHLLLMLLMLVAKKQPAIPDMVHQLSAALAGGCSALQARVWQAYALGQLQAAADSPHALGGRAPWRLSLDARGVGVHRFWLVSVRRNESVEPRKLVCREWRGSIWRLWKR